MGIAIPTGVFDILPNDQKETWRESHLWSYVEEIMRAHAGAYGCHEIRTPIFERTELFQRSVGDATDIVSKEMYTFQDRGQRSMSLRPEGTASVMRAYIEKNLHTAPSCQRLFYIGPMFRYERPQAGRYRQFHHFGVEVIGNPNPELDAELMEMTYSLCERLGLQNLKLCINSLGERCARQRFRKALIDFLTPHFADLSADSQARFSANPLRILDSKDPKDCEIVQKAPSILEFLSPESKAQFEKIQQILTHLQIPYEVNSRLVRGLDYYNNAVFEVTSGRLGAQNSVAGGGRYDGLLKSLGGPDLPSSGYAIGIERLIQVLLQQSHFVPTMKRPLLYLIALGDSAMLHAFSLTRTLRKEGICCHLDLSGKKLKSAMQHADNLKAQFVIVLGEDELKEGKIQLKEMATGKKIELSLESVPFFLKELPKGYQIS
ncbi:MAG: histidine--tRNA ligase [Verrucomicrobia bacterium]|nr:histidine--tRNA ligase [Verrucomicrobiota bacterium]